MVVCAMSIHINLSGLKGVGEVSDWRVLERWGIEGCSRVEWLKVAGEWNDWRVLESGMIEGFWRVEWLKVAGEWSDWRLLESGVIEGCWSVVREGYWRFVVKGPGDWAYEVFLLHKNWLLLVSSRPHKNHKKTVFQHLNLMHNWIIRINLVFNM